VRENRIDRKAGIMGQTRNCGFCHVLQAKTELWEQQKVIRDWDELQEKQEIVGEMRNYGREQNCVKGSKCGRNHELWHIPALWLKTELCENRY
jgi:hypothetical protein